MQYAQRPDYRMNVQPTPPPPRYRKLCSTHLLGILGYDVEFGCWKLDVNEEGLSEEEG